MREIQKVIAIGRGAVGLTLTGFLFDALAPGSAAFVCDPVRRKKYETQTLQVNGKEKSYPILSTPEEFGTADLALFFTKYGALKEAMEEAAPFLDENTILVSGINGVVSEDDLKTRFPNNPVIRAIAQKMDSRYDGNMLEYKSAGELVIGAQQPEDQPALEALVALFEKTGLPYVNSPDIVRDQYSKLMVNCGINQVCAAYGATYGMVAEDPELNALFVAAMEEVRQVLNHRGIDLSEKDVQAWVEAEKTFDADSMPSMAQDILARRKTELELFSGTVVPWAKEAGIQVPVLEDLARKIRQLEESFSF